MRNLTICLMGSSIIEGRIGVDDPLDRWYQILQRMLSVAHPDTCFAIVNSAVGGESTREVINRFDRDVAPYNPDVCIFMIGANNCDCKNPSRILAEGELKALTDNFVQRLPERTTLIGVVLNPVVDEWHFATSHPAFEAHLAQFGGSLDASLNPERDFARAFYRQHGWQYLDLYTLMSDSPSRYVLEDDGIHLNKLGHDVFAREMFKLVDAYVKS